MWAEYGGDEQARALPYWVVVVAASEGAWGAPWDIVEAGGSAWWLPRRSAWVKARNRRQELEGKK